MNMKKAMTGVVTISVIICLSGCGKADSSNYVNAGVFTDCLNQIGSTPTFTSLTRSAEAAKKIIDDNSNQFDDEKKDISEDQETYKKELSKQIVSYLTSDDGKLEGYYCYYMRFPKGTEGQETYGDSISQKIYIHTVSADEIYIFPDSMLNGKDVSNAMNGSDKDAYRYYMVADSGKASNERSDAGTKVTDTMVWSWIRQDPYISIDLKLGSPNAEKVDHTKSSGTSDFVKYGTSTPSQQTSNKDVVTVLDCEEANYLRISPQLPTIDKEMPETCDFYKNESDAQAAASEFYNSVSDGIADNHQYDGDEPFIGMTKGQLERSAWGKPRDINKTTTAGGTDEQWCYSGDRYVYLTNGVVTGIQE